MRFVLSRPEGMADDPHRTEHAQQAFELTDLFAYKFARQIYGGQRPRRLRLNETDGPSTAGGRHARQPLVLVPDRGEGNLVLGWVDAAQRVAEIRTFEALSQQFQARFSSPIDLERGAYDRMRQDLDEFLKLRKIDIKEVSATPQLSSRAPTVVTPTAGASPPVVALVFFAGVSVGLAVGYVAFGG